MSSEEFLKAKKYVLKVSIHCDGCKKEVKKILRKIEGVYTIDIDSHLGKVTVVGNFDLEILINKIRKSGKSADLWDGPEVNNNLTKQVNNSGIGEGHISGTKKQPLVGVGVGLGQSSQVMQLQQIKAVQEQKLPLNKDQKNKKPVVTFTVPCDDLTDEDDDDDDYEDDGDDEDEDGDEEIEDEPLNRKKSNIGGGPKLPMTVNKNTNVQNVNQSMMKNDDGGGNSRESAKVGAVNVKNPTQVNVKGGSGNLNCSNNRGGSSQGGALAYKNCNSQSGSGNNGPKNNGGGTANVSNANKNIANGPKNEQGLNNEPQVNHNMMAMNGDSWGGMKCTSMGQMGYMNGGSDHGDGVGNSEGLSIDHQRIMMMNQQYSNTNETFQPMMNYPPFINYNPAYNTPAPPPSRRADDGYTMFSDEDSQSCNVM